MPILRNIESIHEHADEIVTKELILMLPKSVDRLGFAGDGAELPAQFKNRFADQVIGNWLAVIEPQRQQEFEAAECCAHKSPDLRR